LEKAEYQEYLASREWAEKKEAVKKRAAGICERCHGWDINATHHLTYKNVGNEPLEDLLGVCGPCHAYLSSKSETDPFSKVFVWKLPHLSDIGPTSYESDSTSDLRTMAIAALDRIIRSKLNIKSDYVLMSGGIPYSSSMSLWVGADMGDFVLIVSQPGMVKILDRPEWVVEFNPKSYSIVNVRPPVDVSK